MPDRPANPLLNLVARVTNSVLLHIIEIQRIQLEIYRDCDPRIRLTKLERKQLVKLAKPLGTKVREVLFVCAYGTLLRWKRGGEQPTRKDSPGRSPLPQDLRQLVVKLAEENPTWGYSKILGELRKLGYTKKDICRTSVKNILDAEGITPAPTRRRGDWSGFLKRHAKTLWACDFISRKVLTKFGVTDCFILFFIHLESRKVYLSGVTICPDRDWLAQQARNVCMFFNDQDIKPTHLIHDRDGKFAPMDRIWEAEGFDPVQTPPHSPNCNAFAERWVRSFSDECLNHFVFFGEGHLRHITESFVSYYNGHRPHQAKGNRPLGTPQDFTPTAMGEIQCQEFLGGLLKHYYRQAA